MKNNIDHSATAVISAISGNAFITIIKVIAFLFSGSSAMLAEAIHSGADVVNQIFLLFGIRQSETAPNAEYQWGTGHARYVWNLISAVGVFFAGCGISVYRGIHALVYPESVASGTIFYVSLGVLVVSFGLDGYTLIVAARGIRAKKGNMDFTEYLLEGDDPTIVGVFLEDVVATLGVFIAFMGIYFSHKLGSSTPDAVAAITIGLLLGFVAIFLAYKNVHFLLGASIPKEQSDDITEFIQALPSVESVVSLKTEVLGPGKIHLVLELEFHGAFFIDRDQIDRDAKDILSGEAVVPILVDTTERAIRRLGREINIIERKIKAEFPQVASIDLEVN